LRFSCPHCSSLIELTLDITRAPGYELAFKNGEPREDRQYRPFDGRNPFVDLHLDFPVVFGKYVMGLTPFMAAMERIRPQDLGVQKYAALALFNEKLDRLNFFADKSEEVKSTIRLYFGKNKQLFKQRVEQLLGTNLGPSLLPQDVNAALYLLVSNCFKPLIHHESIREFVEATTDMILGLARHTPEAFEVFMAHIIDTGFLLNIQRDSLGVYPEIYEAEIALRPAIFLDFVEESDDQMIAGRVSANDFPAYKDLYKDLCEILGRQLNLVAGINNLINRGDHNAFAATKDGPALSSLDKFAEKTLSEKFKYLDDCWFNFDRDAVNAGIRNAIAHHITEYEEASQLITYFPDKDGIRQDKAKTMTFLGFVRLILQVFREIHYLHHVIKCLLNYQMLIRSKKENH